MICLDNTDVIEGGAATDAVVEYTFHGLVGTTFTQLAAGVLSDTLTAALYTAGAAVSVVSIILVNTHSAAVAVTLRLDPANGGNPRYIIPKTVSLGVGYSLHTDGARATVLDANGAIIYAYSTHAMSVHSDEDTYNINTSGTLTVSGLGGDLPYNEKHHVFDTTLTSDNTASGDIITVTFGESVVFGQLVYADGTDNEWKLALATNAAVKHPALGVALESKSNGQTGKVLLRGLIRDATFFSGFGLGDLLYLNDGTAGSWLNAAPTDSGDIVQIVGWVLAANYGYFNPCHTYIELV